MELTLIVWQVWIIERDPNKYRLVRECVKRDEALSVAARIKGSPYGVEVVRKSRRLSCTR